MNDDDFIPPPGTVWVCQCRWRNWAEKDAEGNPLSDPRQRCESCCLTRAEAERTNY